MLATMTSFPPPPPLALQPAPPPAPPVPYLMNLATDVLPLPVENQQFARVLRLAGDTCFEVEPELNENPPAAGCGSRSTMFVHIPRAFRYYLYSNRNTFVVIEHFAPTGSGVSDYADGRLIPMRAQVAEILLPMHVRQFQLDGIWPEHFADWKKPATNQQSSTAAAVSHADLLPVDHGSDSEFYALPWASRRPQTIARDLCEQTRLAAAQSMAAAARSPDCQSAGLRGLLSNMAQLTITGSRPPVAVAAAATSPGRAGQWSWSPPRTPEVPAAAALHRPVNNAFTTPIGQRFYQSQSPLMYHPFSVPPPPLQHQSPPPMYGPFPLPPQTFHSYPLPPPTMYSQPPPPLSPFAVRSQPWHTDEAAASHQQSTDARSQHPIADRPAHYRPLIGPLSQQGRRRRAGDRDYPVPVENQQFARVLRSVGAQLVEVDCEYERTSSMVARIAGREFLDPDRSSGAGRDGATLALMPSGVRQFLHGRRYESEDVFVVITPIAEFKRAREKVVHVVQPHQMRQLQMDGMWPRKWTPAAAVEAK